MSWLAAARIMLAFGGPAKFAYVYVRSSYVRSFSYRSVDVYVYVYLIVPR